MLAMLFGGAAKYTDDLSAAVKRGNETVVARGKVPGPIPLGYMKTHEHELAPGAGTAIPDPERFDAVKRIWTEFLTGSSGVSDIWRKARHEWGLTTRPRRCALARPISLNNVYNTLRNPFYAGQVSRGASARRPALGIRRQAVVVEGLRRSDLVRRPGPVQTETTEKPTEPWPVGA
jgi:hypothetical protein